MTPRKQSTPNDMWRYLFTAVLLLLATHPITLAQEVSIEKDLIYSTRDGLNLMLDLARPTDGSERMPALIFLPGNGWGYYWGPSMDHRQYRITIRKIAQAGYVAISIDHSPISIKEDGKVRFPFPTQLYDVKNAIRWARSHADQYGIISDKIGLIGWSSGGHLALLAALTRAQDDLDEDTTDAGYSCNVQAVVSIGAISDLSIAYNDFRGDAVVPRVYTDLLGGSPAERPEMYRISSPINYVHRDSPPILSIMGTNDYPKQAEMLDQRMKEVGAIHILKLIQGMGHSNYWSDPAVIQFFDKYLKNEEM